MKRFMLVAAGAALAISGCAPGQAQGDRSRLIYEPSACVERRLDIYFAEAQARLTQPAQQLIAVTGDRMHGCVVDRVEVIGLASATGSSAANMTLSERRAQVVAEALQDAGWPAPQFTLAAEGDAGALTETGLSEPLRRRTVVVVHARPQ